jgi:hypothetical protein
MDGTAVSRHSFQENLKFRQQDSFQSLSCSICFLLSREQEKVMMICPRSGDGRHLSLSAIFPCSSTFGAAIRHQEH